MIPLLRERVPMLSAAMVTRANTLARAGEIAVLGRAVPYNTFTPYFNERILPGAFASLRVPPPLLSEHTRMTRDGGPPHIVGTGVYLEDTVEGRSLDNYGPGGGVDCCWLVNDDLASVHWIFDHLSRGVSGLSIEFRVGRDTIVREGRDRPLVRHVQDAVLHAVAIVEVPSYMEARIHAVVTPGVSWTRHGTALLPDVESSIAADVFAIEYNEALQRAERLHHTPTVPTATLAPIAARTGRRYGPLEFR